jgi:GNAT superfamily N-acetyltransferase
MREPLGPILPEPHGLLYVWERTNPLPTFRSLTDLLIERADASALWQIADLCGEAASVLVERCESGHQPWQALIDGEPIGWGWVATGRAHIGGLEIDLELEPGERYLWDFTTLPAYRGRRVYSALLRAILANGIGARRFWIGHDAANVASRHGILRAGFREVLAAHLTANGNVVARPHGPNELAADGAILLGLPLVDTDEPGQKTR